MVDRSLVESARSLAVPERLELISELWDSIEEDSVGVSEDVAQLIDGRLAVADARGSTGRDWATVRADLRRDAR